MLSLCCSLPLHAQQGADLDVTGVAEVVALRSRMEGCVVAIRSNLPPNDQDFIRARRLYNIAHESYEVYLASLVTVLQEKGTSERLTSLALDTANATGMFLSYCADDAIARVRLQRDTGVKLVNFVLTTSNSSRDKSKKRTRRVTTVIKDELRWKAFDRIW